MSFDFVAGDTGSVLNVTCKDKVTAAVINLTGSTVNLQWLNAAGSRTTVAMTIVSAVAGTVKYQFTTGQLFAPAMVLEVKITDALSKVVTSLDTISVAVRKAAS